MNSRTIFVFATESTEIHGKMQNDTLKKYKKGVFVFLISSVPFREFRG